MFSFYQRLTIPLIILGGLLALIAVPFKVGYQGVEEKILQEINDGH